MYTYEGTSFAQLNSQQHVSLEKHQRMIDGALQYQQASRRAASDPVRVEPSRWSRMMAVLRAVAGHVLTSPKPPRRSRPALTVSNPSPLLRDMLREDSNHELDWLWAAEQVTAVEEIRYCLERALYINADNRQTQRALSSLMARRTADEALRVKRQGFAQVSDH